MTECHACRESGAPLDFTMAFQPVVDIVLNRIEAYEALVRGCDGSGASIVLAQVTDQNRYSFDQACRVRAIELAARLGLAAQLNINFMPNAVYEARACIRKTLDAAARTGLPLHTLTFEIVEGENLTDTQHLAAIIKEYRRHGFKVALDDFGTGYSGLSRLAALRPDIVKLDRALIGGCDRDEAKRAIVDAIAGLCRVLDIQLTAEGVETRGELSVVEEAGIRFVQGHYFAKPTFERLLMAEELPALLLRRLPDLAVPEFAGAR